MKIFIIGNGFDLAHEMKTGYEDFHAFLQSQYLGKHPDSFWEKQNEEDYPYIPQAILGKDGDTFVRSYEAAQFLCSVISRVNGTNWQDFEKLLGEINLVEYFDDLPELYDREGDRDFWHEAYNNEDRANDLLVVIPMIKDFFAEWISTVDYAAPLPAFEKMIDPEHDIFLSFNYTETLERRYHCKNVIHIHGTIDTGIMVGHEGCTDFSEENVPIGCWDSLERIYEMLRKGVKDNIAIVRNMINGFGSAETVYSYGFSYSSIDLPYVEEFCKTLVKDDAKWLFNDHDPDEKRHNFMCKVRSCGFSGKFSSFHLDGSR